LIVGKRGIVERLRRHPLYRALRSDKIRLAALEATLVEHQSGKAKTSVPVLKMLALSPEAIEERARSLMNSVSKTSHRLAWEIVPGSSATGGGAGPTANLPTKLIALSHPELSALEIEIALRNNSPSIVGRIADQKLLLDLRSVFPDEEALLASALNKLQ
jgi:L-seryl-tRNA(Ser) seleniumtransferase